MAGNGLNILYNIGNTKSSIDIANTLDEGRLYIDSHEENCVLVRRFQVFEDTGDSCTV